MAVNPLPTNQWHRASVKEPFPRRIAEVALCAGILLAGCGAATGATWTISQKLPLGTNVVRILPDPNRPWVYAINRVGSEILFVDLQTASLRRSIYVGKDPSDFDIDSTGNLLYIANKGPGTGLPGSWRIGVVELTNQTLVTSYLTSVVAENVTAGRHGRLYYNSGFDNWNGGDAHSLNTDTGVDLGSFAVIKTHMAIFSEKTHLFGQYTYYGNLGAMGNFDVSSDNIALSDTQYYSPYPYGWDYDNYSLSGDNHYLAYGRILFNPTNFSDQIGLFPEQVYALNGDGTVAFGLASIWDTTTFPIHGDAARITAMPFATTVMAFESRKNVLYAFNPGDDSLCAIEQTTTHGIPFRWLSCYGLSTNDSVEAQDPDGDGYTNLEEWLLDSNPTNQTPRFRLEWDARFQVRVWNTSPLRWYELQRRTNLLAATWQPTAKQQGSGSNLVFDVSADRNLFPSAFYRIRPTVY
jgi:DNA-binding beta-propeller fold protein YncE